MTAKTSATTTAPSAGPVQPATSNVAARAVAIAAATAAGVAVWAIAAPLAGIDLEVATGTSVRTVGVVEVIVTGLVVGVVGAGVLALLERRTDRARGIWTILACAALVVSLGGPLGASTTSAGFALAAMHAAVGLVLILGLRSTGTTRRS